MDTNNLIIFDPEVDFALLKKKCSGRVYILLGKEGDKEQIFYSTHLDNLKSIKHFISDYALVENGKVYIMTTEDKESKELRGDLFELDYLKALTSEMFLWFIEEDKFFTVNERVNH